MGRDLDSVAAMTGRPDLRLGISDVAPVVSCGSFSARAVVGEHLPITATVFREGHDAVAANVVLDPAGRRRGRPLVRMAKFGQEPDRWLATVVPDREGLLDLPRRGVERPAGHLAARRRGEGRGRPGRRGTGQRPRGGRPAARPGRRPRPTPSTGDAARRGRRRAARHLAGADRPDRPGAGRRRCSEYLHDHPVRELVTATPEYEVWVDRPRALYGSWYEFFPRSEGPVVGGHADHGTFASAAGPAAGRRRDGLRRRLPAADPPDRHGQPQGPEQHPDARTPTTSARRGRSAAPRAATTPSTRSWARWRTSRPSSPAPGSWAWRWRWTSRCRPRRTTRGWTSHPEWFTTKPDGTIAYAENPPKKYQDIYPINFDNDPEGIYAECLRVIRVLDRGRGQDLPRRQPAHQAAELLALADLGGQEDRPRRAVPGRGVHPAGDDAPAGPHRVHPVLHVLHVADRARRARGLRPRAGRQRALHAAELLREHPGHPARVAAVRRPADVQDPRRAGRDDEPHLGRLLRLRAVRARRP